MSLDCDACSSSSLCSDIDHKPPVIQVPALSLARFLTQFEYVILVCVACSPASLCSGLTTNSQLPRSLPCLLARFLTQLSVSAQLPDQHLTQSVFLPAPTPTTPVNTSPLLFSEHVDTPHPCFPIPPILFLYCVAPYPPTQSLWVQIENYSNSLNSPKWS